MSTYAFHENYDRLNGHFGKLVKEIGLLQKTNDHFGDLVKEVRLLQKTNDHFGDLVKEVRLLREAIDRISKHQPTPKPPTGDDKGVKKICDEIFEQIVAEKGHYLDLLRKIIPLNSGSPSDLLEKLAGPKGEGDRQKKQVNDWLEKVNDAAPRTFHVNLNALADCLVDHARSKIHSNPTPSTK